MRESVETRKIRRKGSVERAGGEEGFAQSFQVPEGEKGRRGCLLT